MKPKHFVFSGFFHPLKCDFFFLTFKRVKTVPLGGGGGGLALFWIRERVQGGIGELGAYRCFRENPPLPYRIGGTSACFPLPEPPYLGGKDIPLYLGYWFPLAITKAPPSQGFLRNLPTSREVLHFPEKIGRRMRPLNAFGGTNLLLNFK